MMYFEIYKGSKLINTIVGSEEFVASYCEKHGYTYIAKEHAEPEPEITEVEQLRADVDFIAIMSGIEL